MSGVAFVHHFVLYSIVMHEITIVDVMLCFVLMREGWREGCEPPLRPGAIELIARPARIFAPCCVKHLDILPTFRAVT
jgi:hypothetical protein